MADKSEASVEEILESIKKVMERDSRATATRVRQRKAKLVVEEEEQQDQTLAADRADEDEVLDLTDLELSEIVELEDEADSDAPLVADEVRGAMQENLAALAMLAQGLAVIGGEDHQRPGIVRREKAVRQQLL